jgi:hypothetical protein
MYASRAKNIKNKPIVQMDPRDQIIMQLRREIQLLRAELEYFKGQRFGANTPREQDGRKQYYLLLHWLCSSKHSLFNHKYCTFVYYIPQHDDFFICMPRLSAAALGTQSSLSSALEMARGFVIYSLDTIHFYLVIKLGIDH